MATGYVIATDSRKRDEVLFMVNRRVQRASFWSNRLDDVFIYKSRDAAEARVGQLRDNNPRVLTLREAIRLEAAQGMERMDAALADLGWDEHKVWGESFR